MFDKIKSEIMKTFIYCGKVIFRIIFIFVENIEILFGKSINQYKLQLMKKLN